MKATFPEIEQYLKLLEETPRRIQRTTRPFEDARLQRKNEKQPWSVNDILAHLRSCADVWGDSITAMLADENPKVPYRHPRQWIKKTDYLQLPFQESFQAFVAQRRILLKALKSLSLEDWSRAAIIKGREHTVFTQVRRMGMHENVHCEQIESLLN
jgi:DinB family protein